MSIISNYFMKGKIMKENIECLNKNLNNNFIYQGPKYLYKYRPFDKYNFDMLENGYLSSELQEMCPKINIESFIKWIINIL